MATVEEIEKRRQERREAHEAARNAQMAADLEAIEKLEIERDEPLHTMTANGFKPGVPVKAAFCAPTKEQYKRYCDQVGQAHQKSDAQGRRKAQELLAESCWLYPAPKSPEREKMLEAFGGLLLSIAIEAAKVAELRSEDEGKG